jgi:hypothetical protein
MRKRMKSSLPLLLAVNLLCLVFLLLMKRMMMLSVTSLAWLRKTDFKIT